MTMGDQLDAYESPHKMPAHPESGAHLDAHHTWYQHRERYAASPIGEEGDYAREVHMRHMLDSVSMTNPPVNRIELNPPAPAAHRSRGRWLTPGAVALVYVIILIIFVVLARA